MRFALTIRLGNAEMQTGADVAHALRGVAARLDALDVVDEAASDEGRVIFDINGQSVGTYTFTEDRERA